jgi:hypothetical protein
MAVEYLQPAPACEVERARREAVGSAMVGSLASRLRGWDEDVGASGHNSPNYLPNLLHLLADFGVRPGEDDRVERVLDQMCDHQTAEGRFQSFGRARGSDQPVWGSLPCDTHIICDLLIRFGRSAHPAVAMALDRIGEDLVSTRQGDGWTCVPDPAVGFRGPGRRGDVCPQVTLEALRLFGRLPPGQRPACIREAARTALTVWRSRGTEQPYMFGHGYRFKVVKWPPFWYGAYWLLDALAAYPELWSDGDRDDRSSIAELLACLVAYNIGSDGTVTPRSCFRGFEDVWSKRHPSPVATAMLASLVSRYSEVALDAAGVDVTALSSSKGGSGVAKAPS